MTFTMTAQEEGEMWAESAQSVVCDITLETFEFTHEMSKRVFPKTALIYGQATKFNPVASRVWAWAWGYSMSENAK